MGDTRWTPRSNPPGASTSSSWPPRRESMHAEKMQASRLCSGGPACITTSLLKPVVFGQGNDPSAGSPTETLLRLLLPLSDPVWPSSRGTLTVRPRTTTPPRSLTVQKPHYIIRSVVATGGVYKGQGRNQRKLLTRAYWEFLVRGAQLQAPVPTTKGHEGLEEIQRLPDPDGPGTCRRTSLPSETEGARCLLQCSARAAQSIEGHHRPVIAPTSCGFIAAARPSKKLRRTLQQAQSRRLVSRPESRSLSE